jgi:transcriptional regulator with XRE-family HTH domain
VTAETTSDIVAGRVREARKAQGWTTADLAARCAELGHPELTKSVIENIEGGRRDHTGRRRRSVTVDELRILSDALRFSPADILDGLPPGTIGNISVDQLEQLGQSMQSLAELLRLREAGELPEAGD